MGTTKETIALTREFYQQVLGKVPEFDIEESVMPELKNVVRSLLKYHDAQVIELYYFGDDSTYPLDYKRIGSRFERSLRSIWDRVKQALSELRENEYARTRIDLLFLTHCELAQRALEQDERIRAQGVEIMRLQNMLRSREDEGAFEVGELGHNPRVEALGLSRRVLSPLTRAGVRTLTDLLNTDYKTISLLQGIGAKGIREVEAKLESLGFQLKGDKATFWRYYNRQ
ncbi:MAG: hypothetical protein LBQ02_04500 [Candidatus Nomurabacteria bacterium]|jgi:hypothetical protein|nr:hypothetical protein [Candidatus Nomurabacteria bacterium]